MVTMKRFLAGTGLVLAGFSTVHAATADSSTQSRGGHRHGAEALGERAERAPFDHDLRRGCA